MSTRLVRSLLALCLLSATAPAVAQDTRAAVIGEEQAEKAKTLRPYEPNRAERLVTRATRNLLESPGGFYPSFGSVYSGGGFTVGAGYRRFYGDRAIWNAGGLYSIKNYKLLEVSTLSPGHASGHVDLYARTTWRDAPSISFYGTGPDSLSENRTPFALTETSATAGLRTRWLRWIVFGGAMAYEDFNAPTLDGGVDATYVHSSVNAGFDSRPSVGIALLERRPSVGYARRGGLYAVEYHNYADRTDAYNFERLDADVVQHIPILRENWVLSLRGRWQTTLDGGVVPYYLLPSLGSGSTLRAFPSWRFRDRHSELYTVEWRWIPSRLLLDMALFYDAGKVASERSDLNFSNLEHDYGIGVRFHGPVATPLRIELARGREGTRLVFSGGPAF
jgi:hypothetical protein